MPGRIEISTHVAIVMVITFRRIIVLLGITSSKAAGPRAVFMPLAIFAAADITK